MPGPSKKWEDLSYSVQKRLYAKGDPRVPEGFKPKPHGRPKGVKMPLEVRRRMANSRGDATLRVARAIETLLKIYGSRDEIILELARGHQSPWLKKFAEDCEKING